MSTLQNRSNVFIVNLTEHGVSLIFESSLNLRAERANKFSEGIQPMSTRILAVTIGLCFEVWICEMFECRYRCMLHCWEAAPESRPDFTSLVKLLGDFLETNVKQVSAASVSAIILSVFSHTL